MLDHIEDPQNLGAILRTAEFFGAMGAILPKARAAPITPSVIKTSSGAVSHLPIARTSNLVSTVDTLKTEGFWIAGADPVADTSVYDADFANIDVALVIGNEGKGMSRLVKEKCDYLFAVPRTGEVESLNASAAAAVMISEIMRQWTRG